MSDYTTVLPPGQDKPQDGKRYYVACNEAEWLAATLKKGDRCWFRNRIGGIFDRDRALSPWKAGTFHGSYFRDGVSFAVIEDDPDDRIVHKLHIDPDARYTDDLAPWGPKPETP